MTDVVIHAPVDGWLIDLSAVPDAAFSGGMVGPGVAIDPTSTRIVAPFDGVVSGLPASRHAVTLRSEDGVEVLIHVGLETVALAGRGFAAHVAEGAAVRAGDLLLSLDLDTVADGATSLITPVVVVGGASAVAVVAPAGAIRAGAPLLRVSAASSAAGATGGAEHQRSVRPTLPLGLHARPAARIAACVRAWDAEVVVIHAGRRAAATSLVGLMGLGVRDGDELVLSATGPQALDAIQALERLMAAGLEEAGAVSEVGPRVPQAQPVSAISTGAGELILTGVTASPGLAIGRAVRLRAPEIQVQREGRGVEHERQALDRALAAVHAAITREVGSGDPHRRAILAAHLAFLSDPGLTSVADVAIAEGASAGWAWRTAMAEGAQALRALGDARMAERADDLLDLERQVLSEIAGVTLRPPPLGNGAVVLADDLLPSQLMALEGDRPAALCTARGGPTSHVAILAAAMGVPFLVAVGAALDLVEDGALVVLDADGRRLIASPSAARQAEIQSMLAARERRQAEAIALAGEPCHTVDGTRIEVFANLGEVQEAGPAVSAGAEGCGLLRTEFLFLHRETAPGEDEQLACYQAIADALEGRPLIIRTLDAGGDKPLAYLPLPPEENPALGLRGVRSGLYRPDILMTQLRAICRVRSAGEVAVMLPMIASLSEVEQVRALLARAALETQSSTPSLGVMIETPAAAVSADLLAGGIEFISIGTNDLTQYALAMDRQHAGLAAQADGLHPAVLRLIAQSVRGGGDLKRLGVCGGLASEPLAAAILIGLGVNELSVAVAMVPEIKAVVRRLRLEDCKRLAERALAATSPGAVRELAAEHLAAALQNRPAGAVA